MAEESLDIPISELPFEAGQGFSATVSEDGIAHITVLLAKTQERTESAHSQEAATAFLRKWGGSLASSDSFRKDLHSDDPRMLHYIEKFGLDA
ncbi:MAG: hypothetical protein ACSHYB_06450 [Roseibacillus sp.]